MKFSLLALLSLASCALLFGSFRQVCGDGFLQEPEETCDDGNEDPGDGCSDKCALELPAACGDLILEPGEQCDDGNTVPGDGCDQACQQEPVCGNGKLEAGESCDDGNQINTDGCLIGCVVAFCGDGFIHTGVEQCDDGNNLDGDGCSGICALEAGPLTCGNGVLDLPDEECEGSDLNGQSCQSLGLGFTGGFLGCFTNCQFNTSQCSLCGNGVIDPGEQCEGADLGGQSCTLQGHDGGALRCQTNTCQLDASGCTDCGDGAADIGEFCYTAAAPLTANQPVAVALSNFNTEPALDIAIAELSTGRAQIFSNNGQGSFGAGISTPTVAAALFADLAAASLKNAGSVPDLILANANGEVILESNSGSGTFTIGASIDTGPNDNGQMGPISITAGAFGGSNLPDFAISNRLGKSIFVCISSGAPGCVAQGTLISLGSFEPKEIASGDLDGDGDIDIAALVKDPGLQTDLVALANNGDGTFSAPQNVDLFGSGVEPAALTLVDLDNNGTQDVIAVGKDGSLVTDLSGVLTAFAGVAIDPKGIAASDLNGDNFTDVVIVSAGSNELVVLFGQAVGFATAAASFVGCLGLTDVALAELNGDALPEIVATCKDENKVLLFKSAP